MNLNIEKYIEYSKKGITSKDIVKDSNINVSLFCMAAGTAMSEHTSTKKGIIYVIEGKGVFNLEGKNIKMKEGVIITMNKNAVHSLKADKNTSFILILTK